MGYDPQELEIVEREEHAAWLRLSEARDEHRMSDGEVPPEQHELLHKLAEEWRRAMARVHSARRRAE